MPAISQCPVVVSLPGRNGDGFTETPGEGCRRRKVIERFWYWRGQGGQDSEFSWGESARCGRECHDRRRRITSAASGSSPIPTLSRTIHITFEVQFVFGHRAGSSPSQLLWQMGKRNAENRPGLKRAGREPPHEFGGTRPNKV